MWYSTAESALKNLNILISHRIRSNARAKPPLPARLLIAARFARRWKIWNLTGRMNAKRWIWPATAVIQLPKETLFMDTTTVRNAPRRNKPNKKTESKHFQRKKQKTRNESKYFLSKMKCWRSLLKNSWKKFFNSSNSSKLCLSISNRQVKAKQSHLLTLSNLKNPSRNSKPQKLNPFPKIMR